MKTNITLTRLTIHDQDESVALKITDRNGKQVSIAFDPRADVSYDDDCCAWHDYGIYGGCPIIDDNDKYHELVTIEDTLRVLRDVLNRMELGS